MAKESLAGLWAMVLYPPESDKRGAVLHLVEILRKVSKHTYLIRFYAKVDQSPDNLALMDAKVLHDPVRIRLFETYEELLERFTQLGRELQFPYDD